MLFAAVAGFVILIVSQIHVVSVVVGVLLLVRGVGLVVIVRRRRSIVVMRAVALVSAAVAAMVVAAVATIIVVAVAVAIVTVATVAMIMLAIEVAVR